MLQNQLRIPCTELLSPPQHLDTGFFLLDDPTTFDWRRLFRTVVPPSVWTSRLERKIADELHVAYGYHAVVGDFTWWMLAWLEGGRIPPIFKEDVLTLRCLGVMFEPIQRVRRPKTPLWRRAYRPMPLICVGYRLRQCRALPVHNYAPNSSRNIFLVPPAAGVLTGYCWG